ncbi:MAG: sulfite reductase (NADPH) flavoprotein alpha-component [Candidatus Nitrotoga sp. SPKER]|nr:MAG: sulfite reductase (NADPH) flavoprotein alpha-component [Candidatus Nitrotoga sp. SPKER]
MNRTIIAGLIIIIYLALSAWVIRRHHKKRSISQGTERADVLLAFASQTGHAGQLAVLTSEMLLVAGLPVQIQPLSAVTTDMLSNFRRVLFIVSTTGEGDAPENAVDFMRAEMHGIRRLDALEYGLLALGDRRYKNFCGFGHLLDTWLQQSHALPLFDMVEVDDGDPGALRHWQSQLSLLTGLTATTDWNTPIYQSWRLKDRQLLNPGSAGEAVYHIKLEALEPSQSWQAGDIAEIGPRNSPEVITRLLSVLGLQAEAIANENGATLSQCLADRSLPFNVAEIDALRGLSPKALVAVLKPLSNREYSIASLPHEGLELVVRQFRHENGQLGPGSGWLTEYAKIGQEVALRVRRNIAFHAPANAPPLILIGSGTGIAGLRAHLKASIGAGQNRHWLVFGERNKAHDDYFGNELQGWYQQGVLTRLDIAWSRDQDKPIYVQDMIRNAVNELRMWLHDGATILVCGSANRMAPAVHHALVEIVGDKAMATLAASGRYRRDVY